MEGLSRRQQHRAPNDRKKQAAHARRPRRRSHPDRSSGPHLRSSSSMANLRTRPRRRIRQSTGLPPRGIRQAAFVGTMAVSVPRSTTSSQRPALPSGSPISPLCGTTTRTRDSPGTRCARCWRLARLSPSPAPIAEPPPAEHVPSVASRPPTPAAPTGSARLERRPPCRWWGRSRRRRKCGEAIADPVKSAVPRRRFKGAQNGSPEHPVDEHRTGDCRRSAIELGDTESAVRDGLRSLRTRRPASGSASRGW
jgi:hypothetical protein